jgi:hypothetical protein
MRNISSNDALGQNICFYIADIVNEKKQGKHFFSRWIFMMTNKKKILILCLLILLVAVLLTYDSISHSANFWFRQKDNSEKLAELEAALIKAASAAGLKSDKSGNIKQTHTGQSPKARST